MSRLRLVIEAVRAFARGYLGIATPVPRDAAAARAHLEDAAKRRPHCC
jgi:hypothetical protein